MLLAHADLSNLYRITVLLLPACPARHPVTLTSVYFPARRPLKINLDSTFSISIKLLNLNPLQNIFTFSSKQSYL